MAAIAEWLDVTPDAFEVESSEVGGRPAPTGSPPGGTARGPTLDALEPPYAPGA